MNRIYYILSFLTVSCLLSCTKSVDNTTSMTALINNTPWKATSIQYKDTTHNGLRELTINGTDSNSRITIDIVRYNGIAFYNSNISSVYPYIITAYIKNNTTHYTDTAQVAVNTTTGNNIKGTFFITTTDTIKITNGNFNIFF
jgi:hypothetical protein